ncbi:MAG: 23S rRNA (pseudouridine(1915)-N(3))-methyltransferase RlmH [bacterium]
MKTTLIAVGKARAPFAEADAHYLKLLSRRLPVELIEVRDGESVAARVPERAHVVALDSSGEEMSSEQWADWLDSRKLAAVDLCFLIGGAHGLSTDALDRADQRISLGQQTMAHQLARAVLLEQLFRATKILAGEAYHY